MDDALPPPSNPTAAFETSAGSFTVEIFLDRMPLTASNFIQLAKTGFYDGLHFHRVIPDFMAQFGCPLSRNAKKLKKAGMGGPEGGSQFPNLATKEVVTRGPDGEIPDEHTARISNEAGTISMANSGPNTGGSQFFINTADNFFLDWWDETKPSQHVVFGRVTEGMDVVVGITKVQTKDDCPKVPIKVERVRVNGA